MFPEPGGGVCICVCSILWTWRKWGGHKKWRVQTPFPTEVLTPTNVSAQCNGTASAHLRWDLKSRFLHNFLQYELQINKSNVEPGKVIVSQG